MYARILVFASLAASFVAAANIPGLPQCAGDCVGDSFGGCQQLNVQCICTNQPLLKNLACCVSKNCDEADQKKTIDFANAICAGENVSDLPQTATCVPGASGYSGTATASSTAGSSGSTGTATGSTSSNPTGVQTTTDSEASATPPTPVAASSSQAAVRAYDVGLGMMVAGIVAAL